MAAHTLEWYKKSFKRRINHKKDYALRDTASALGAARACSIDELQRKIEELHAMLDQYTRSQEQLKAEQAAKENHANLNIIPKLDDQLLELDLMVCHVVVPTDKRITCDAWCRKNTTSKWMAHKTSFDLVYFFENKNDAMLFKLTFG